MPFLSDPSFLLLSPLCTSPPPPPKPHFTALHLSLILLFLLNWADLFSFPLLDLEQWAAGMELIHQSILLPPPPNMSVRVLNIVDTR